MSEERFKELIHCWFSQKQHGDSTSFTWFEMDDGSVKKVSETHTEHHGDAGFLRNFPDAEYVGFGHFSHVGPTATPE